MSFNRKKIRGKTSPALVLFLTFFLSHSVLSYQEEFFGALEGKIVSVSPGGDEIEVVENGGNMTTLIIGKKTLVWHQNEIIANLGPEHVSLGAHIEYTETQDGRLICEWLEFSDEDGYEQNDREAYAPRIERERGRQAESRFDRPARKKTKSATTFEPETRGFIDSPPQKNTDKTISDEDYILTEGKSLIEMTPEEYNQNVDREAQKILKELGIE